MFEASQVVDAYGIAARGYGNTVAEAQPSSRRRSSI